MTLDSPRDMHLRRLTSSRIALATLLVLPAACGGGGGGGAAPAAPATASAPTVEVGLANAFVDPDTGETKGDPTGLATVSFTLSQGAGDTADVVVEYSINEGVSWTTATIEESLVGLGASVAPGADTDHQVTWNLAADLGPGNWSGANSGAGFPGVQVRVRVVDGAPSDPSDDDVEVDLLGLPIPGGDPMGFARAGHETHVLPNGNILVLGGDASGGPTSSMEIGWRPDGIADFAFQTTSGLVTPRTGPTVTMLYDTRLLIAGGRTGSGDTASAEVFDPVTGDSTAVASMAEERSGHSAGLLSNGHVLVVGGAGAPATAEVYSPEGDSWTPLALSTGYFDHAMARLADGRFLVVGSAAGTDTPASTLFTLQADGSVLESAGPVPGASRYGGTATPLPDGRVLVFGGRELGGGMSDPVAEVFDPAAESLSPVDLDNDEVPGFAIAGRSGHAAAAMGDGSVLIAGGRDGAGELVAQTEFFLPLVDVFTPAAPLPEARADHQVDVLAGGVAVVTGGLVDQGGEEAPIDTTATILLPGGLNETPSASGASLDWNAGDELATITYTLSDFEGDPALVRVDWRETGSGDAGWRPAREGLGGDGRVDLSTSSDGVVHTFEWDAGADGVFDSAANVDVDVRVTPVGAVDGAPTEVSDTLFQI